MARLSKNPVIPSLISGHGLTFTRVYSWGAAPFMMKALLLNAEVGITFEGSNGTTRMLIHSALQRPLTQLPWPLSLAQPHSVGYSLIGPGQNVLERQEFGRSGISDAIELFLSGLDENDIITITVE